MEPLINNGFNGMTDTIKFLMDSSMKIERGRYFQAEPYERAIQRHSYANGIQTKNNKNQGGRDLACRTRDQGQ